MMMAVRGSNELAGLIVKPRAITEVQKVHHLYMHTFSMSLFAHRPKSKSSIPMTVYLVLFYIIFNNSVYNRFDSIDCVYRYFCITIYLRCINKIYIMWLLKILFKNRWERQLICSYKCYLLIDRISLSTVFCSHNISIAAFGYDHHVYSSKTADHIRGPPPPCDLRAHI